MSESEHKIKAKKPRGIGGVLQKQLLPLETNERFTKRFSNLTLKILINAKDTKYAALVTFNNGKILVESIKNKNKKVLKKKVLNWDGMLSTSTPLLLKIATGKLSIMAMAKKIITRKLRIKGIKKLLIMRKIFELLI